jgi:hypothetical protein
MAWIIASTTFVVSFPTIASAMTGYAGNNNAFVQDRNGNLIPWNDSLPTLEAMIYDGWRVNLRPNYPLIRTS